MTNYSSSKLRMYAYICASRCQKSSLGLAAAWLFFWLNCTRKVCTPFPRLSFLFWEHMMNRNTLTSSLRCNNARSYCCCSLCSRRVVVMNVEVGSETTRAVGEITMDHGRVDVSFV